MSDKTIYAIATIDPKSEEINFVAERASQNGIEVKTIDVGTGAEARGAPDVSRQQVAACHDEGEAHVLSQVDRGQAVAAMGEALAIFLSNEYADGKIAGVIGAGGSGGTSLIASGLRALPIGLPKLLVSTVASGNTAPYVHSSDITMMYSVVDIAGLNNVSRAILSNAAHAISGMVKDYSPARAEDKAIGMTMFGVTTPCVDAVRKNLESSGHDCLVFHATGSGGRAMENLINSGYIDRVLDITTTEVADEVVGGIFPCGGARFDGVNRMRIPCVMSLGALDMVNFGGIDTVPPEFKNRNLRVHNPEVTLMRTSAEENRMFANWIADKVNRSTAPMTLLIPEGGVSMLDAPGQPFHDPEADQTLFDALEESIQQTEVRKIVRTPHHINDPEFSRALLNALDDVTTTSGDGEHG